MAAYENLPTEMRVITEQPRVTPSVLVTYPIRNVKQETGVISNLGSCILWLFCIAVCPISTIFLMIYPCCSLNGRTGFMMLLKYFFMKCCCRFDCVSSMSLSDALNRYEENLFPYTMELIESMMRNKFLISILETLNTKLPSFFFTFLPSGSLRERFGKFLPSTSILASDYDIMMIPDAVSVGEEQVEYITETPVFRAISAPNEHPDGFVWLKLEDKYLEHWEKLCLRRHVKNEGCSLLSSTIILQVIREILIESNEIRYAISAYYGREVENPLVTVEQSGPACAIKIKTYSRNSCKCGGCVWEDRHRETTLFHTDYTLALHCTFWPKQASGFFDEGRRRHWPQKEVVDSILRLGCHVVPKQSTKALVKLTAEQAEYSTYGSSPGLEWRYSFSQAEMILSDQVPAPARTAFLAVKAINKRHLDTKGRKLGSYTLKCILFYVVEMKDATFWDRDYMLVAQNILTEILERLLECFNCRKCPNYWIPTMDTLDLDGSDCARKSRLLVEIMAEPKQYIADQWLEYARCIRLNCCYCGDSSMIPQYIYSSEVPDAYVPEASFCCSCKYNYDNDKETTCGPCQAINDFPDY